MGELLQKRILIFFIVLLISALDCSKGDEKKSETGDLNIPETESVFTLSVRELKENDKNRRKPAGEKPSVMDQRFESIRSKPMMDVPKVK